jgi:saccharopine dehydrogenase (NAD+, L-lysine-forming)
MRVAVLGAGGTIAPAIVRDLAASEEISAMLLLDLDGERAEKVAELHGQGKAKARALDARLAHALVDSLGGVDALINSASYRINLEAMNACLEAHCHYLDLGGLYWLTAKQLELSKRFERENLTAVLGIGSAPGKTNLLAARAVEELGGTVDSLHVSAAGRDMNPPPGESFPYALATLLDEVRMAPVAVRGGKPVELSPLSDGGIVEFGDPIGAASVIHTIHSEMLTFPTSFGCSEASFRLSLPGPVEERLRELADSDEDAVAAAIASASPPSPDTVGVHLVEAASRGCKVRARSITPPHEEWGLGGGIVSTASPIAAAARLMAQGRISARGALPPESCIAPGDMFTELESRGVRFEVQSAEEVAA